MKLNIKGHEEKKILEFILKELLLTCGHELKTGFLLEDIEILKLHG